MNLGKRVRESVSEFVSGTVVAFQRPLPDDQKPRGSHRETMDCSAFTCLSMRRSDAVEHDALLPDFAAFPAGSDGGEEELRMDSFPWNDRPG